MTTLLVCLLLATAIGLLLRRADGRFRPGRDGGPSTVLPSPGDRATLVQISADRCATCPAVARVLAAVAADTPGVAHVELRAEDHPELLARYDVRRSPTVLVVDGRGRLRARSSGAVRPNEVRAALAPVLDGATDRTEVVDVHVR